MSPDLPSELPSELRSAIADAADTVRERQVKNEERLAAQLADALAARAAEWGPRLAMLRAALPAWLHPYIQPPSAAYETKKFDESYAWFEYSPVSITVPGCSPIAAWIDDRGGRVVYEVMQPRLEQDDDGRWLVHLALVRAQRDGHTLSLGEPDVAVALLGAREAWLKRFELEEQAAERNREGAGGDVLRGTEAASEPADPIEQALTLISKLSRCQQIMQAGPSEDPEDFADERTLVLASAGLAIAHHLRRAADALERMQWSER